MFFPFVLESDSSRALNSCSSSIRKATFARPDSMVLSAPSQQTRLVGGISHLLYIWGYLPRLIHLVSPLYLRGHLTLVGRITLSNCSFSKVLRDLDLKVRRWVVPHVDKHRSGDTKVEGFQIPQQGKRVPEYCLCMRKDVCWWQRGERNTGIQRWDELAEEKVRKERD